MRIALRTSSKAKQRQSCRMRLHTNKKKLLSQIHQPPRERVVVRPGLVKNSCARCSATLNVPQTKASSPARSGSWGEDVLNEVGVDMESYFKELLTKAMGWEQTLLCVQDLSTRRFCYYLPVAWPLYFGVGDITDLLEDVETGSFVFYWND